jgi:hypothetical protein
MTLGNMRATAATGHVHHVNAGHHLNSSPFM